MENDALWYHVAMNTKELRVRVPVSLAKRYRMICVSKELSLPKQTAELIRKFVEVQEENEKRIKDVK